MSAFVSHHTTLSLLEILVLALVLPSAGRYYFRSVISFHNQYHTFNSSPCFENLPKPVSPKVTRTLTLTFPNYTHNTINMYTSFTTLFAASAAIISVGAVPFRRSESASMTPHDKYSSSIGVPGCKINTNRVAYWPGSVNCDDICVKVTKGDRSLHLLRIDSSAGAHDISYDAWNHLGFGSSAEDDPQTGGGINMEYEYVDNEECKDLLDDGKLPLSAANSMNYLASCLAEPSSWVAKNHELLNILDSQCQYGKDEKCTLDLDVSNQPSCPSTLGATTKLDKPVMDIAYGTGKEEKAQ